MEDEDTCFDLKPWCQVSEYSSPFIITLSQPILTIKECVNQSLRSSLPLSPVFAARSFSVDDPVRLENVDQHIRVRSEMAKPTPRVVNGNSEPKLKKNYRDDNRRSNDRPCYSFIPADYCKVNTAPVDDDCDEHENDIGGDVEDEEEEECEDEHEDEACEEEEEEDDECVDTNYDQYDEGDDCEEAEEDEKCVDEEEEERTIDNEECWNYSKPRSDPGRPCRDINMCPDGTYISILNPDGDDEEECEEDQEENENDNNEEETVVKILPIDTEISDLHKECLNLSQEELISICRKYKLYDKRWRVKRDRPNYTIGDCNADEEVEDGEIRAKKERKQGKIQDGCIDRDGVYDLAVDDDGDDEEEEKGKKGRKKKKGRLENKKRDECDDDICDIIIYDDDDDDEKEPYFGVDRPAKASPIPLEPSPKEQAVECQLELLPRDYSRYDDKFSSENEKNVFYSNDQKCCKNGICLNEILKQDTSKCEQKLTDITVPKISKNSDTIYFDDDYQNLKKGAELVGKNNNKNEAIYNKSCGPDINSLYPDDNCNEVTPTVNRKSPFCNVYFESNVNNNHPFDINGGCYYDEGTKYTNRRDEYADIPGGGDYTTSSFNHRDKRVSSSQSVSTFENMDNYAKSNLDYYKRNSVANSASLVEASAAVFSSPCNKSESFDWYETNDHRIESGAESTYFGVTPKTSNKKVNMRKNAGAVSQNFVSAGQFFSDLGQNYYSVEADEETLNSFVADGIYIPSSDQHRSYKKSIFLTSSHFEHCKRVFESLKQRAFGDDFEDYFEACSQGNADENVLQEKDISRYVKPNETKEVSTVVSKSETDKNNSKPGFLKHFLAIINESRPETDIKKLANSTKPTDKFEFPNTESKSIGADGTSRVLGANNGLIPVDQRNSTEEIKTAEKSYFNFGRYKGRINEKKIAKPSQLAVKKVKNKNRGNVVKPKFKFGKSLLESHQKNIEEITLKIAYPKEAKTDTAQDNHDIYFEVKNKGYILNTGKLLRKSSFDKTSESIAKNDSGKDVGDVADRPVTPGGFSFKAYQNKKLHENLNKSTRNLRKMHFNTSNRHTLGVIEKNLRERSLSVDENGSAEDCGNDMLRNNLVVAGGEIIPSPVKTISDADVGSVIDSIPKFCDSVQAPTINTPLPAEDPTNNQEQTVKWNNETMLKSIEEEMILNTLISKMKETKNTTLAQEIKDVKVENPEIKILPHAVNLGGIKNSKNNKSILTQRDRLLTQKKELTETIGPKMLTRNHEVSNATRNKFIGDLKPRVYEGNKSIEKQQILKNDIVTIVKEAPSKTRLNDSIRKPKVPINSSGGHKERGPVKNRGKENESTSDESDSKRSTSGNSNDSRKYNVKKNIKGTTSCQELKTNIKGDRNTSKKPNQFSKVVSSTQIGDSARWKRRNGEKPPKNDKKKVQNICSTSKSSSGSVESLSNIKTTKEKPNPKKVKYTMRNSVSNENHNMNCGNDNEDSSTFGTCNIGDTVPNEFQDRTEENNKRTSADQDLFVVSQAGSASQVVIDSFFNEDANRPNLISDFVSYESPAFKCGSTSLVSYSKQRQDVKPELTTTKTLINETQRKTFKNEVYKSFKLDMEVKENQGRQDWKTENSFSKVEPIKQEKYISSNKYNVRNDPLKNDLEDYQIIPPQSPTVLDPGHTVACSRSLMGIKPTFCSKKPVVSPKDEAMKQKLQKPTRYIWKGAEYNTEGTSISEAQGWVKQGRYANYNLVDRSPSAVLLGENQLITCFNENSKPQKGNLKKNNQMTGVDMFFGGTNYNDEGFGYSECEEEMASASYVDGFGDKKAQARFPGDLMYTAVQCSQHEGTKTTKKESYSNGVSHQRHTGNKLEGANEYIDSKFLATAGDYCMFHKLPSPDIKNPKAWGIPETKESMAAGEFGDRYVWKKASYSPIQKDETTKIADMSSVNAEDETKEDSIWSNKIYSSPIEDKATWKVPKIKSEKIVEIVNNVEVLTSNARSPARSGYKIWKLPETSVENVVETTEGKNISSNKINSPTSQDGRAWKTACEGYDNPVIVTSGTENTQNTANIVPWLDSRARRIVDSGRKETTKDTSPSKPKYSPMRHNGKALDTNDANLSTEFETKANEETVNIRLSSPTRLDVKMRKTLDTSVENVGESAKVKETQSYKRQSYVQDVDWSIRMGSGDELEVATGSDLWSKNTYNSPSVEPTKQSWNMTDSYHCDESGTTNCGTCRKESSHTSSINGLLDLTRAAEVKELQSDWSKTGIAAAKREAIDNEAYGKYYNIGKIINSERLYKDNINKNEKIPEGGNSFEESTTANKVQSTLWDSKEESRPGRYSSPDCLSVTQGRSGSFGARDWREADFKKLQVSDAQKVIPQKQAQAGVQRSNSQTSLILSSYMDVANGNKLKQTSEQETNHSQGQTKHQEANKSKQKNASRPKETKEIAKLGKLNLSNEQITTKSKQDNCKINDLSPRIEGSPTGQAYSQNRLDGKTTKNPNINVPSANKLLNEVRNLTKADNNEKKNDTKDTPGINKCSDKKNAIASMKTKQGFKIDLNEDVRTNNCPKTSTNTNGDNESRLSIDSQTVKNYPHSNPKKHNLTNDISKTFSEKFQKLDKLTSKARENFKKITVNEPETKQMDAHELLKSQEAKLAASLRNLDKENINKFLLERYPNLQKTLKSETKVNEDKKQKMAFSKSEVASHQHVKNSKTLVVRDENKKNNANSTHKDNKKRWKGEIHRKLPKTENANPVIPCDKPFQQGNSKFEGVLLKQHVEPRPSLASCGEVCAFHKSKYSKSTNNLDSSVKLNLKGNSAIPVLTRLEVKDGVKKPATKLESMVKKVVTLNESKRKSHTTTRKDANEKDRYSSSSDVNSVVGTVARAWIESVRTSDSNSMKEPNILTPSGLTQTSVPISSTCSYMRNPVVVKNANEVPDQCHPVANEGDYFDLFPRPTCLLPQKPRNSEPAKQEKYYNKDNRPSFWNYFDTNQQRDEGILFEGEYANEHTSLQKYEDWKEVNDARVKTNKPYYDADIDYSTMTSRSYYSYRDGSKPTDAKQQTSQDDAYVNLGYYYDTAQPHLPKREPQNVTTSYRPAEMSCAASDQPFKQNSFPSSVMERVPKKPVREEAKKEPQTKNFKKVDTPKRGKNYEQSQSNKSNQTSSENQVNRGSTNNYKISRTRSRSEILKSQQKIYQPKAKSVTQEPTTQNKTSQPVSEKAPVATSQMVQEAKTEEGCSELAPEPQLGLFARILNTLTRSTANKPATKEVQEEEAHKSEQNQTTQNKPGSVAIRAEMAPSDNSKGKPAKNRQGRNRSPRISVREAKKLRPEYKQNMNCNASSEANLQTTEQTDTPAESLYNETPKSENENSYKILFDRLISVKQNGKNYMESLTVAIEWNAILLIVIFTLYLGTSCPASLKYFLYCPFPSLFDTLYNNNVISLGVDTFLMTSVFPERSWASGARDQTSGASYYANQAVSLGYKPVVYASLYTYTYLKGPFTSAYFDAVVSTLRNLLSIFPSTSGSDGSSIATVPSVETTKSALEGTENINPVSSQLNDLSERGSVVFYLGFDHPNEGCNFSYIYTTYLKITNQYPQEC